MNPRKPPTKLERAEALWAFIARILAFLLGVGMLVYETPVRHGQDPYLIVAGIVLLGVPVAGWVEPLLKRLPGPK